MDNQFDNSMGRVTYRLSTQWFSDRYDSWSEEVRTPDVPEKSHVVSSELGGKMHAPAIDIDFPARVLPSSTPGHSHLYIDKAMTWWQYKRLLRAMVRAGLVEKNYYQVSKSRGGTHLRLPWIKKGDKHV